MLTSKPIPQKSTIASNCEMLGLEHVSATSLTLPLGFASACLGEEIVANKTTHSSTTMNERTEKVKGMGWRTKISNLLWFSLSLDTCSIGSQELNRLPFGKGQVLLVAGRLFFLQGPKSEGPPSVLREAWRLINVEPQGFSLTRPILITY